jgi:hypothetical protein
MLSINFKKPPREVSSSRVTRFGALEFALEPVSHSDAACENWTLRSSTARCAEEIEGLG